MLNIFIANEQKKEIVDFVRNGEKIRCFKDENEVMDYRSSIAYGYKYTAYVFDIEQGEIIDWWNG